MALPGEAFHSLFEEPIGQGLLAESHLRLLVFDGVKEAIVQWIPLP